jgi:hypothetical protein
MLEVVKAFGGVLGGKLLPVVSLIRLRDLGDDDMPPIAILRASDWQKIDALLQDIRDGGAGRHFVGWRSKLMEWSATVREIYTGDERLEIPPAGPTAQETAARIKKLLEQLEGTAIHIDSTGRIMAVSDSGVPIVDVSQTGVEMELPEPGSAPSGAQ